MSDIKANVVNIATPNGFHCPQAILALDNCCHVVIEKLMGLSKAECENVIFKALNESEQMFVVKQNRYGPTIQWMKKVVSEKKNVGKVSMVQVNCYWNRDDRYYKRGGWKGQLELDGGTLYTQFIDIMYWVFGDIKILKPFL